MTRSLCQALLFVALTVASARADDAKDEARRLVGKAETEYKLGRFQQALDLYSRAYKVYKAPGLFFNIAQCHYRLRKWNDAVFFYEAYLREKPDAPNRVTVEELIGDAKRERDADQLAIRTEAERKRLEAQRRLVEERRAAAEAEARLVSAENARRDESAGERSITGRWWFWAGVVGIAAACAGGTLYYFSGETTVMPQEGSLGVIDTRPR
jgi:tetratricopeptide (TPR) repeat protein